LALGKFSSFLTSSSAIFFLALVPLAFLLLGLFLALLGFFYFFSVGYKSSSLTNPSSA